MEEDDTTPDVPELGDYDEQAIDNIFDQWTAPQQD
jgi:hypothetical protein